MDIREYMWSIGAAIYVLGMFPIFILYQQGDAGFSLIDYISIFGAFVVMFGQAFVFFWPKKKETKLQEKQVSAN